MAMPPHRSPFLYRLGSSPRIRVLQFLIERKDSDCTLTDMLGAQVSWGTLNHLIPLLLQAGLIRTTRKIGRATLYTINQANETAAQLIAIHDTLTPSTSGPGMLSSPKHHLIRPHPIDPSVLESLRSMKRAYKPHRLIVFGSQARGDTHAGSDVDVILIKRTRKRFTDRIGDVLRIWKGKQSIEPLVYTPKEFQSKSKTSDLIKTAIREGIEI